MTRVTVMVLALAVTTGCGRIVKDVNLAPDPAASIDELWQRPEDLERRDLFYGAGGKDRFPKQTTFTCVARDTTGWSPGRDVRDDASVEWSVKLGPKSQSEVVASRVLWAIGFHQPPTYSLENWSVIGTQSGPQPPGRFRPAGPGKVGGEWSG